MKAKRGSKTVEEVVTKTVKVSKPMLELVSTNDGKDLALFKKFIGNLGSKEIKKTFETAHAPHQLSNDEVNELNKYLTEIYFNL